MALARTAAVTVVERSSERSRSLKILVAEDESLIALDLQDMLERLGYQVIGPVATVADIRRVIQDGKLDGAILDVNLRGEQVFEILPALLKVGLPVILASGYDDAQLFPDQFRTLPRVTKPFTSDAVKDACVRCFRPGEVPR